VKRGRFVRKRELSEYIRMEMSSQLCLKTEADNWLNRGRAKLLELLIRVELQANASPLEILELGAGAGQNAKILSKFGSVDVVEASPFFAKLLSDLPEVRTVFEEPIPELALKRKYDLVCALDVLEHIEDDLGAVDWISDHLSERGLFIGTVPAYQWLFSDHDRANQHYRRYTSKGLGDLIGRRLKLKQQGYFNMTLFPVALVGRVSWQLKRSFLARAENGKQSSDLSEVVDRLFGRILCWEAKRTSQGWRFPFGLSAFCVAYRAE